MTMLHPISAWIISFVLLLANVFTANRDHYTIVHVTAFAQQRGDVGAWEMCGLHPGISASFSPNPSHATPGYLGVVAERTTLTLHTIPKVAPGLYRLIFISFSYVNGPPPNGPLVEGLWVPLRVHADHTISVPPFNHWYWVFDAAPQYIAPQNTCTAMPDLAQ